MVYSSTKEQQKSFPPKKINHQKDRVPVTCKMANENKIAKELLSLISKYPYRRYIQYIAAQDSVSDKDFQSSLLYAEYWIDKQKCYTSRGINTDCLFELFGLFSDQDGWSVQKEMVELVKMEQSLYETVGRVILSMCGCTIEYWLEELQDPDNPPDELILYCLSQTYNHHTLVVCKNRYWSPLEIEEAITEEELFNHCHVKLAYLGDGIFGELKRKPYSQNLNNQLMTEQESMDLMKIRGVGRPMKCPLNLSVKPTKPSETISSEPSTSGVPDTTNTLNPLATTLTEDDHSYLTQVLSQLQTQNETAPVNTNSQTNSNYLFKLFPNITCTT